MEVARSVLPRQLLTLSSVKDVYLSLSLLFTLSLTPTTIHLSPTTSLHLWHPPSPSPKPPLLLIHGFGGNSRWQFHRQLPALSRRFDLYLPDLLFFGRSHTSGPHRSVQFQARCLVQAMAALGVRNYSVAGISYGGYVAYRVAEMERAVGRVVIMTAGVAAGEEERREMAEREGRDVADILLPQNAADLRTLMTRSLYRPPPTWLPDFLLRDFIKLMYKEHRKERVELLKDLLSNGVGMNPIPILKQETLILWGDQDDVFPIDLAYKLQRHLGPKARVEVIKDAGHALQLEKSDVVNNLLERFLLEPYSLNTAT